MSGGNFSFADVDDGISSDPNNTGADADTGAGAQTDAEKLAESQRKIQELQDTVANMLAGGAVAGSSARTAGPEDPAQPRRYTTEELNAFAKRDGGKYAFDATKVFVEQTISDFEGRLLAKLEQGETQVATAAILSEIDRDLANPNSQLSKRADEIHRDYLARFPRMNKAVARDLASVAALKERTAGTAARNDSGNRAIGASVGAGVAGSTRQRGDRGRELSEAELENARRLGAKSIDSTDEKVRNGARHSLLQTIVAHEQRNMGRR